MTNLKMYSDLVERYPVEIKAHAIRVSAKCSKYGFDYVVVGLLHDIIEDTYTELGEIPEEFRDDVATLTRRVGEPYFEYINRVKNGSNRAIIVKLYDIEDHLEQRDTLSESLRKRYIKAHNILMERFSF